MGCRLDPRLAPCPGERDGVQLGGDAMNDLVVPAMAADERRRGLALYVLWGGRLMVVLAATIVNVALPTIQEDLGFSQNDLAWVVNAYLIAFGGLLLLSCRVRHQISLC